MASQALWHQEVIHLLSSPHLAFLKFVMIDFIIIAVFILSWTIMILRGGRETQYVKLKKRVNLVRLGRPSNYETKPQWAVHVYLYQHVKTVWDHTITRFSVKIDGAGMGPMGILFLVRRGKLRERSGCCQDLLTTKVDSSVTEWGNDDVIVLFWSL